MTPEPTLQVHICDMGIEHPIKAGVCLVTKEDQAIFPWRPRQNGQLDANPEHDDVMFPEKWRIPRARNGDAPNIAFKTVCKVTSVSYSHAAQVTNAFRKVVDPRDVLIDVQIFVRPSDIGLMPLDPYELIKTDQGDVS